MIAALPVAKAHDPSIEVGAHSLGIPLSERQIEQLHAYVAVLVKWNRTYNLTAIREPAKMITHHLLDALAVLPHLPQRQPLRLLDVGSGAGLPGIPLAVARPGWSVVMVDSNGKKAAFVTQAAIELGLANVRALATRVEDLRADAPFDVVIARAFSSLRTFALSAEAQLAPGGRLYAMKGALPGEEIAALPAQIEVVDVHALRVPGVHAERHLVVMEPRGARA